MKDIGYILAIAGLALYAIIGAFKGYQREEAIKDALRRDSMNVKMLNDRIQKIDSGLSVLNKKDSIQSAKIDKSLKKLTATKKRYEKASSDFPVLPEF